MGLFCQIFKSSDLSTMSGSFSFSERLQLNVENCRIAVVDVFYAPGDGACLFHSIEACAKFCAQHGIPCPRIPQTVLEIRQAVCDFLRNNADKPILVRETTPIDHFETNYGQRAKNREEVVDPDYNKKIAVLGGDPRQFRQYVNTFDEWVCAMEQPHAFVDEVIVNAAALCFGFCFIVYTRSISMDVVHEETGDQYFDSLVCMGFSPEDTGKALSTTGGDHARALEILLSLPSQPSKPLPNLWRVQKYNPSGFPCNLINGGDHYEFMLLKEFKPFVGESDEVAPAPLSRPPLPPSPAAAGGGVIAPPPLSRPPLPPSPAVAGGGGQVDSRGKPLRQLPSCPHSPSSHILSLPAGCLDKRDPHSFFKNVEEIAQSSRGHPTGSFFVSPLCMTLHDLQHVFQIFGSFPIGSAKYRVIACMFDDGRCAKYAGSPKDLSIESEKKLFSSDVASVLSDPKRTLVCVLVSRCD